MRKILHFFGCLLVTISMYCGCVKIKNTQTFDCDYMGFDPPGKTPVIFAPEVISTSLEEFGCSFSPDGKDFYFTRTLVDSVQQKTQMTIMVTHKKENGWTLPEVAPFCGDYTEGEPNFSPSGHLILFGRLTAGEDGKQEPRVMVARKTKSGWSEPVNLMHGMFATIANDNIIFYTDVTKGYWKGDIFKTRYRNGKHQTFEKLEGKINSEEQDAHPFVTPEGDLLIFDSNRPGGFGENDLYVSFRQDNGSWSDPINMGATVNTKAYDAIPYLTPDRKYFFFTRNEDIYWVDASFIKSLRSE